MRHYTAQAGAVTRVQSAPDAEQYLIFGFNAGPMAVAVDAQQPSQSFIAAEFCQTSLKGGVSQQRRQHDHAPQHRNGIIVAAPTAPMPQALEQAAIGQQPEKGADGLEGRTVFKCFPSEQRPQDMDLHSSLLAQRGASQLGGILESNQSPGEGSAGVRIREKWIAAR